MMLRNDFAFFEVVRRRRDARLPGGADQLAPEGRGGRPISSATAAPAFWSAMPTCWPQIRDGVARDLRLLIVPTPPEIAAAFNIAAELTQSPGMTDWDAWRDTHAPCAGSARSACHRCSIPRAPPGGPRACGASRCGPEQLAAAERVSAHRLRHHAQRRSGRADERPDVPFGAELLRHAGVPQWLHDRAGAALRSRGSAAAGRSSHRITPHAYGADHVRPAAAAAGGGRKPL